MAKYFLVDVVEEFEEDVEFGTCELCMFVADHRYSVFIMKNAETGKEYPIEMGTWSWGDYFDDMTHFIGVNIGDFAEFLHTYNGFPDDPKELTHSDIVYALWEYEEEQEVENEY